MKNLLSLVFALFFTFASAQMDTEHWFAPMAGSPGSNGSFQPESYLYLSTSETIPFQVEIYNNNILYTTVQIAKGSPQTIDIPFNFMMTILSNEMFTPVPMGIHVKGSKKFFANYRFAVPNHAEIITSKGLAGVGKNFFAVMAPLTAAQDYINATIGIIATEDNTTVKLSGYNPAVVFADGTSSPTKTFTLNKGQSYIIDAISNRDQANRAGLVGAKIEATQPIAVTNGNFNAIYTNENSSNNDILMDQSVPVERLGNEFIMVKGNGPSNNNMESALIVASEDNTHIMINGVDTGVVLNAGKYHVFGVSNYVDQGKDHYNMSISTTQNVYVYQLLAGIPTGNVYATGGFNFIPALSCFLPNKIDEISSINQIGYENFNTKLNIISEKGATVRVNGNVLSGFQGPFPVQGNSNWETYTVLNVSGNITVNSTKSVTAGIAAGNGAVGYGGYFAGFSSVPVISKTGDCYSGVLLQVDDSYDQYQWYLNGVTIPGATTYFVNPDIFGPGDYTCIITKTNCDTKLTTPYQFTSCPPISTTAFTIGSCNTTKITPNFTTSTQVIVPGKTRVSIKPSSGTATVDATTGIITYTPNSTLTADTSDIFVYYIEGNGTPEDTEYFKVIINIKVLQVKDDTIRVCPNPDGTGTFNLSFANISTDITNTILYFTDQGLTNPITNFTNYNTNGGIVYAKITSSFRCIKVAQITLEITSPPILNLAAFNSNFCDDLFTGSIPIKFSTISPQIISNYNSSFIVKYYLDPADQQSGNTKFLPDNWSFSNNTTVYIRIENTAGCPVVLGQMDFTIGIKTPLITIDLTDPICDDKRNDSVTVDLNKYVSQFTLDSLTPLFFASIADARNNVNPISASQTLSTASKTFGIRLQNSSDCPNVGEITIIKKTPDESLVLQDQIICGTSTTSLDAGSGFNYYKWSTGEEGILTSTISNVGIGTYYVDLTSNGCTYRQTVKVTASELPQITNIDISGSTATVFANGGTPPYQYSLDNITFQDSNIFSNVPRGLRKVYLKDAQNCETINKEFLILNLINVITPNADGKNDVLDYSDLSIKKDVKIEIYDRYGNQVFISQKTPYIWDGKINGRVLPTGTYWYILNWIEPATNLPVMYKGWVLLKNRN
ncbi:gliding motility-associated C-terminal domain-containing protein [Kaistella flava (ex Peng et al. 2021)]|uniref:Gliding motility-associated C-terminal domain-containing protein n=1 Tax=Kaistella flava (ex Peng et al. 2021) TaxID=2038776 RepID=A0A7M2YDP5_9FLAO|nr:T9SS type B sorting domain-containing protein [Kaistella flava (ex Peng et al. 2021)]QOW11582.1 gliding motility-associated C-terminal domain-containing protein [Kaistella flava (ex Peng et al. 2021)]